MIIRPHGQASRSAMFSARTAMFSQGPLRLWLHFDGVPEELSQYAKWLIGLALFLLPLSQGKLVAQQAPPYGQAWSQSDSYGMYPAGYGQQGYLGPALSAAAYGRIPRLIRDTSSAQVDSRSARNNWSSWWRPSLSTPMRFWPRFWRHRLTRIK